MNVLIKQSVFALIFILISSFSYADEQGDAPKEEVGVPNVWVENYTDGTYRVYLDKYVYDYWLWISPNYWLHPPSGITVTKQLGPQGTPGKEPEGEEAQGQLALLSGDEDVSKPSLSSSAFFSGNKSHYALPGASIFIVKDAEKGEFCVFIPSPEKGGFNHFKECSDIGVRIKAKTITLPVKGTDQSGLLIEIWPVAKEAKAKAKAEGGSDSGEKDKDTSTSGYDPDGFYSDTGGEAERDDGYDPDDEDFYF